MNTNAQRKIIRTPNLEKNENGKKHHQAIQNSTSSETTTPCKIFDGVYFLVESAVIFILMTQTITLIGLVLYHIVDPDSENDVDTNVTSDKKDIILHSFSDFAPVDMNITEECYKNYIWPVNCVGFMFMFIAAYLIINEAVIRFWALIEFCKTGRVAERDLESENKNFWVFMGAGCLIADIVGLHIASKMEDMRGTAFDDIICMKDVFGFYGLCIVLNVIIMIEMFLMLATKDRRIR